MPKRKVAKEKGTTNAAHLPAANRLPSLILRFAPHRSWTSALRLREEWQVFYIFD
ncbi:MAG: hypothetical protein U0U09_17100 [Cyclobacteriaceae bacterium]